MSDDQLASRAARHAALGDPTRLRIVDELVVSDRAPSELARLVGLSSNLLAHHLDVLESAGLVARCTSSGDGRRRYVRLRHDRLDDLRFGPRLAPQRARFVCSANSARSQLAAALWRHLTDHPADSAGTHPAERVHPGAVAAAQRAGIDLRGSAPRTLEAAGPSPALVVTVCDQAHEELGVGTSWLHWSVPDPVTSGSDSAFDEVLARLRERIVALVAP